MGQMKFKSTNKQSEPDSIVVAEEKKQVDSIVNQAIDVSNFGQLVQSLNLSSHFDNLSDLITYNNHQCVDKISKKLDQIAFDLKGNHVVNVHNMEVQDKKLDKILEKIKDIDSNIKELEQSVAIIPPKVKNQLKFLDNKINKYNRHLLYFGGFITILLFLNLFL